MALARIRQRCTKGDREKTEQSIAMDAGRVDTGEHEDVDGPVGSEVVLGNVGGDGDEGESLPGDRLTERPTTPDGDSDKHVVGDTDSNQHDVADTC